MDEGRVIMSITGNQCEVTVTSADAKDNGEWDIHIGAGKDLHDFLKDNKHHIESVTVIFGKILKRYIYASVNFDP